MFAPLHVATPNAPLLFSPLESPKHLTFWLTSEAPMVGSFFLPCGPLELNLSLVRVELVGCYSQLKLQSLLINICATFVILLMTIWVIYLFFFLRN